MSQRISPMIQTSLHICDEKVACGVLFSEQAVLPTFTTFTLNLTYPRAEKGSSLFINHLQRQFLCEVQHWLDWHCHGRCEQVQDRHDLECSSNPTDFFNFRNLHHYNVSTINNSWWLQLSKVASVQIQSNNQQANKLPNDEPLLSKMWKCWKFYIFDLGTLNFFTFSFEFCENAVLIIWLSLDTKTTWLG